MTDVFMDPGDPGELRGSLRAGDLLNLPCLFRVTGEGEWPAKPEENKRAQPYMECDVVVLGAGGIENHASGVRISWARVVPAQLNMGKVGQWVPARPKQQDDRSIVLMGFDARGKEAAAKLLPEAEALFAASSVTEAFGAEPVAYAPDEEPF